MPTFAELALMLLTFVLMEPLSWALHRYVMHGIGWRWHESHHRPHRGYWEVNDLYSLLFSLPSIVLLALGYFVPGYRPAWFIGLGVVLYGLAYFVVHDGLIHRRFKLPITIRSGYLKRLLQAHRLHHAVQSREGGVSFGFLYAPPPRQLARTLRAR